MKTASVRENHAISLFNGYSMGPEPLKRFSEKKELINLFNVWILRIEYVYSLTSPQSFPMRRGSPLFSFYSIGEGWDEVDKKGEKNEETNFWNYCSVCIIKLQF